MFRLQRPTNRPSKSRERVDFKFSNFQALQVPKGWDRLFMSLISVETGKTIAKLGKALVKNGSCQWTETLSESIHISRDDSSKGYEECLVKLLVSTGSTRSSPLGEIIINMSHYTGSRASTAFSQPLKKCSYGTILQAKIQCLTPRLKIGDVEVSKNSSKSLGKNRNVDFHDADGKSHRSDNSNDSVVGPLIEDLATTSHQLKLDSKEASQSGSVIIRSFDSDEGSIGRENLSISNALNIEEYNNSNIRQVDYNSIDDVTPSNHSSSNSTMYLREDFRNEIESVNRSTSSYFGSSKNLLEAAEDTIKELRAEAKMWERNARKLMIDLDVSRKEFSDVSKTQAELVMEFSAEHAENDGLKKEVEKLKLELQKLTTNGVISQEDYSIVQSESMDQMQKVVENEIKYQQDLNDSLGQQLKRSQESNIELLSVLQELEETVEQQKIEIEKLQGDVQLLEEDLKQKISVKEEEIEKDENNENNVDLVREIESLREKVQELERDCAELTDENLELLFKLKDSNKTDFRKSASFDSMSSEHPNVSPSDESEVSDPKFQISQLEEELKKKAAFESSECFAEISKQVDTAFELLMKPWYCMSSGESEICKDFLRDTKISAQYVLSFLQEMNKLLEMRISESGKIIRDREIEIKERNEIIADAKKKLEERILEVQELEKSRAKSEENYANLMKELDQKRSEVDLIEANLLSEEEEINFLLQRQRELEAEVSELQQEKNHLEQNLQNDLTVLRETVNSHVSGNANLERNLEALERKRHELENTLMGLQEENMQLKGCISDLGTQVRQLKDEKEICLEETENFKSVAMNLQDEIQKLRVEMNIQILDFQQKSEDFQKRWLVAQQECQHLKEENKTLESSAASYVQENTKIQNSNSELKSVNQELQENCSALVAQLSESKKSLSDCNKKVELLEGRLTSLLDDFALRENSLKSQLDELVKENNNKQSHELKVQDLTDQLAASKQSHGRLMADHERILKMLASYKKSEEKLKTELNDLELKHTISEYECHQQLSILKAQVQNISSLHDEISVLKSELEGCRLDKGKLEDALKGISGDYEELNAQKISLYEKVSIFQDAMSEFEECKRTKLALVEKLRRMERELTAKEVLENELTETKRANVQFQQKMCRLEEEKDECLKKARVLEEDLKLLMEERHNIHKEGAYNCDFHDEKTVFENEVADGLDANNNNGVVHGSHTSRERYERTKSSLETELRDLRERYLEMSLKYAEVEGEREDLVMKLKATRSGKRWFS